MSNPSAMPDVWGAGQLFAFSGLDGKTVWDEPMVFHTAAAAGGLRLRRPGAVETRFERLAPVTFKLVLGDVFAAESPTGSLRAVFLDHHTLAGEAPEGARLLLAGRAAGEAPVVARMPNGCALHALQRGRRWALLMARADDGDGDARTARALSADLDAAVAARSAYVRNVPAPTGLDPARLRLFRKAVSVQKVNTEAASGRMKRRWTTPDRWPHMHMWLWDSAFHALGMLHYDTGAARDAVLAMLEQVDAEGRLNHTIQASGATSTITQPPLLGWAALETYRKSGDRAWASACLPLIWRYLEWDRTHRDQNDNGVPEWLVEGHVLCRCGESGLDNSSRFDREPQLDAVDFAGFLCHDYRCYAELARDVGADEHAEAARSHADRIAQAANALLWSQQDGIYFDRTFAGAWTGIKAVSAFVPMLAGIPSPAQAKALAQHLADPASFAAPFPVPSLALDEGTYCKDMWRGPTWLNLNYVVYRGLQRCGFDQEAARLREQCLALVGAWYEKEGCLFEFYDSLDVTSPRKLDRKQRLALGKGMAPISDYHWTAAVTVALLCEARNAT